MNLALPALGRELAASLAGCVDNSRLLQIVANSSGGHVANLRHNLPLMTDIHRWRQFNQEFAAQFDT
jgi:hypothetical protein